MFWYMTEAYGFPYTAVKILNLVINTKKKLSNVSQLLPQNLHKTEHNMIHIMSQPATPFSM